MTKAKTKQRPADSLVLFDENGPVPPIGQTMTGATVKPTKIINAAEPSPDWKPSRKKTAAKHTYEDERQRANDTAPKTAVTKIERFPPSASPTNMLAIIADAAANPKVDVEKMRALLQMQREIMTEEARIAFTEARVVMRLPSIDRDGRIDEGITKSGRQGKKTLYATFENINRVTEPILKENGFNLWFEPDVGADGKIIMRGHLDHVRGHGKSCAISLPLETQNKNALQGIGSSISYGKRYAAIALLNIVSHALEDRDVDGADPKKVAEQEAEATTINGSQAKELLKAIDECGVAGPIFLQKYKVNAVHELPASMFAEAIKACRDYGARTKAKQ